MSLLQGLFHKEPRLIVQVGARLIVVVLAVAVLPSIFVSDINHYWEVGKGVSLSHLPYRDFLWEFPPLTTLVLLLVPISGRHHGTFFALFVVAMVASEFISWRLVRRLVANEHRAFAHWYWLAVVLPLSAIAYFRLDWPSAMFGALALCGLVAGKKTSTALGVLGGFAVKAWTIVFVAPLLGLRRWGTAALSLVICLVLVGVWRLFSPEGLDSFLRFRKGTGFQIESIPGSFVMLFSHHPTYFDFGAFMVSDQGYRWLQSALPAAFVVIGAATILVMWKRPLQLVPITGALVLLLLLTSRILSPQYLVWLAPFVVALAASHRRQALWFAVAVLLTLVEINCYKSVYHGSTWASAVLVVRNMALVGLLVELFLAAWRKPVVDPSASHRSTIDLESVA